jgi:hypothetical protein
MYLHAKTLPNFLGLRRRRRNHRFSSHILRKIMHVEIIHSSYYMLEISSCESSDSHVNSLLLLSDIRLAGVAVPKKVPIGPEPTKEANTSWFSSSPAAIKLKT